MTSAKLNAVLRKLEGGFNAASFGEYEIRTAFQPIYTLDEDCSRLYGVEALCLLYTSPSPRDQRGSRMPSSA